MASCNGSESVNPPPPVLFLFQAAIIMQTTFHRMMTMTHHPSSSKSMPKMLTVSHGKASEEGRGDTSIHSLGPSKDDDANASTSQRHPVKFLLIQKFSHFTYTFYSSPKNHRVQKNACRNLGTKLHLSLGREGSSSSSSKALFCSEPDSGARPKIIGSLGALGCLCPSRVLGWDHQVECGDGEAWFEKLKI
ncbi:hypothetical protein DL98DRAFT_512663 [Cadophora sp. DSE1049]|nr:hypothetical protein DL98DRAFT_512663 [Cadophora sp. DSE1049]